MSESPVTYHQGDDAQLLAASASARESFKYFWNMVTSDFNRIIPAIEMSAIKAPFADDWYEEDPAVEHMWLDEINFDGQLIHGSLLNAPNWLQSIQQGQEVTLPLEQLGDWICVMSGDVYGAHSVQVIRGRMDLAEREQHDAAWGLDFPPPDKVLIPQISEEFENNLAKTLAEQFAKEPAAANAVFDEGRTLLHLSALYGRAPSVITLLQHGASPAQKCNRGWTAMDYAKSLEWEEVMALLNNA